MNLKKTLFGFSAATVLSLSMIGGAVAQSSTTASGSVTLEETDCSVVVNRSNFGLGIWRYDGEDYQWNRGSSPEQSVNGTITAGSNQGCTATLQFSGLTGPTTADPGDMQRIGLDYFSGIFRSTDPDYDMGPNPYPLTLLSVSSGSGPGYELDDAGLTMENVPTSTYNLTLILDEVPGTFDAGVYMGTVTWTVSNTQ